MNFDGIYNCYERLVYDEVMKIQGKYGISFSIDNAEDIACLALNQLPARYVRHSVDAAFYLGAAESNKMDIAVEAAVETAFQQVRKHPGRTED